METNKVVEIKSTEDFYAILKALPDKYFIVDFNAEWCGPCKRIKPQFHELAHNNPKIGFLSVDVDKVSELAEDYEVTAMPTFIILLGDKIKGRIIGANIEQVSKVVNQISTL